MTSTPYLLRSRLRAFVSGGVALALLCVAAWGLGSWKPFEHSWPSQWETRVEPLAAYVEKEAGYLFKHPVNIRFLDDTKFNKLVTSDETKLSSSDKRFYANLGEILRTLGLANGDVDIFGDQNTLNEGNVLAFYSSSKREMVVRADEKTLGGGALSPSLGAVVVHELTHALQDQQFGLARIRGKAKTSQESEAITALLEGHANSVERRWVEDNLDDKELEEYQNGTAASSSDKVVAVPEILSAQQSSPYIFGPTFVTALEQQGDGALQDAFMKNQPKSLEQIILPSKYFAKDSVEKLATPKVPSGAKLAIADQLSQLDIYFLLARTLGAPAALKTSDLWGNATYTAYRKDKVMCVAMNITGDDEAGTKALSVAFTKWTKVKTLSQAKLTWHDTYFAVSACDPGKNVKHALPSDADSSQIFWRSGDIAYIYRSGDPVDAECVATGIYSEFTAEQIATDDAVIQRYGELLETCATAQTPASS